MENYLTKMIADKKLYRRQKARIAALPEAYRYVYEKVVGYMWSYCGGTGSDMLKTQYDLIDLFESGAANSRHVLEITGEDVGGFCDALMRGNRLWTDDCRKRLNRKVARRLENAAHR